MRMRSWRPAALAAACSALGLVWSAGYAAGAAGKTARAGRKLKAIVITGGHGYDRKAFPEMFKAAEDMDLKFHDGGKKGSSGIFDDISDWRYDVIVLYNFRQKINEKQRANLLALLKRGVGFVSVHHAIAAYPEWREYEKIIGATYVLKAQVRDGVKYPRPTWKHGIDMNIHVEDPAHPITKGLADFVIHDETYKKWIYHEGNKLLLTTDHKLSNKQIAWTRRYEKARVFFIQLGHDKAAYRNETFQGIIARGIRWAGEGRPGGKS